MVSSHIVLVLQSVLLQAFADKVKLLAEVAYGSRVIS